MSALALKPKNPDCYVSDRVFDGVRTKSAAASASHVERLKRILSLKKAETKA